MEGQDTGNGFPLGKGKFRWILGRNSWLGQWEGLGWNSQSSPWIPGSAQGQAGQGSEKWKPMAGDGTGWALGSSNVTLDGLWAQKGASAAERAELRPRDSVEPLGLCGSPGTLWNPSDSVESLRLCGIPETVESSGLCGIPGILWNPRDPVEIPETLWNRQDSVEFPGLSGSSETLWHSWDSVESWGLCGIPETLWRPQDSVESLRL
ncbi:hypothetical protein HGM15179_013328 [Zosterops borbonicus]|uniref:Uncharacterized protein n=1 Tax=Zosterops borbonicus TaxID=364589 RepID=A0A8K1G8L1_9PASS|nr:hypothetical protein HGM15179_013328 [Zosterops borbonicus]